ncbi:hypothetical protein OSB04_008841 [Centaurea solstitialis]|uniref:Uncharacterized protein n=1 Tax=Centaurea solstitialis TaxID=347529 RepID=A0AA38TY28_9ASTR|nr:hypothetical protein OSB04_008841 [Centaurea solstitialis]
MDSQTGPGLAPCLNYSPPELSEPRPDFDTKSLRKLLDGQSIDFIDHMLDLMLRSNLFCPRERGGKVFVSPDYNQSMEEQREMTMKRVDYLREKGAFDGWFSKKGDDGELWRFAVCETLTIFDHSLAIKVGVHFFLWYAKNPSLYSNLDYLSRKKLSLRS